MSAVLQTPLGFTRAWIRLALNHKVLDLAVQVWYGMVCFGSGADAAAVPHRCSRVRSHCLHDGRFVAAAFDWQAVTITAAASAGLEHDCLT